MYIAIPKALLGFNSSTYTVNYKWTDNTLSSGDINDFYLHGDTAPGGRFNYVYKKLIKKCVAMPYYDIFLHLLFNTIKSPIGLIGDLMFFKNWGY